jgi:NAD(P)-dependent dehydrogenase (short-subunit alcohol dehydrogenase family)
MELGLKDKVAVVTGASRGIGRAIALELAKEGCDLIIAARDATALAALSHEIRGYGRRAMAQAADLRAPEAPVELIAAAVAEFGRLDIVVNNAGATKRGSFFELSDADFQDGFALKFHGAVRLTRAAWPELRKTSGSIINIIGIGGHHGGADFTIGGAVNAAFLNFTKAMADLGVDDGVRVNAINPGWIETDRLTARLDAQAKGQGIDKDEARRRNLALLGVKRFGRADEIGQLACFLASPAASYIQGALIDIDGGATRHL